MKLLLIFRIILFPVLLPVSLIYGFICLIRRVLGTSRVKLPQTVVSVGNIQVGGTGKTPIVGLLCSYYKEKAVVISRNYGASKNENIKMPQEVELNSKISEVGDEALEIKHKHPYSRVFSGPVKSQTALFASKSVSKDSVFIIDDGAQHLKLKRDLDIIVWDVSRPLIDFFPFPFGMSREFWFTRFKKRIDIINRIDESGMSFLKKMILPKESHASDYSILDIRNLDKRFSPLTLISGIGNYDQLKKEVICFLSKKEILIDKFIRGKDHDDFKWFKPEDESYYIATLKDKAKLLTVIDKDKLFIVESGFSNSFRESFFKSLKESLLN